MLKSRRRVIALAVVLTLATGASCVAVAVGGDPDPTSEEFYNSVQLNGKAPRADVIPAGLAAHFAVLRGEFDGTNDLPTPVELVGGTPESARPALTTDDGDTVYVVPADNGVCIASSLGRASACYSAQDAIAGDSASAIICSPSLPAHLLEVNGVLPDEARNVRAVLDDGSTRRVDVTNNVFVVQFEREGPLPTRIEWETDAGAASTSSSVPPGAGNADCATPADLEKAGITK